MYLIFRLVLFLVHFFYTLYYLSKYIYNKILLMIQQEILYNWNHTKYNQPIKELNGILLSASKFPKHLAVIFGNENVSFHDLANVVSWCIKVEIPCISFYDHTGKLQENENSIKSKLYEIHPSFLDKIEWLSLSNHHISEFKNGTCQTADTKTTLIKNGTNGLHKHKTKVKVLSYADGKTKIVSLTKSLAQAVNLDGLNADEITPELIDKKLSLDKELPDPDLAIVFGKVMSTYGFLPWHTRVTEFFLVPKECNLTCHDFVEILIQFSKCEQRYGK